MSDRDNGLKKIATYDELQKRKDELDRDIDLAKAKVARSTEEILSEGVKILAAGMLAAVVSQVVSHFASSSRETVQSEPGADRDESGSSDNSRENKSAASDGDEKSIFDVVMTWLNTISGAVRAAKIIMDEIRARQEEATEEEREVAPVSEND